MGQTFSGPCAHDLTLHPKVSSRGLRSLIAEIVLAPGPLNLADTGDGSFDTLFGYVWLFALDKFTGSARLFQAVDGFCNPIPRVDLDQYFPDDAYWDEHPVEQLTHPIHQIRHISFTFDQAARYVLAYEHEATEQIYVRQWDPSSNQFVYRGPFDGHDPVLINDTLITRQVLNSDVVLFQLSESRREVLYRIQQENYADAHSIHQFAIPVILDQATPLPIQLELALTYFATGLDNPIYLQSQFYPYGEQDNASATATPQDGEYVAVILRYDHPDTEEISATATPKDGEYVAVILRHNAGEENASATAIPQDGEYVRVVLRYDHDGIEDMAATVDPQDGEYVLVIIRQAAKTEEVDGTVEMEDSYYHA